MARKIIVLEDDSFFLTTSLVGSSYDEPETVQTTRAFASPRKRIRRGNRRVNT